MLPFFVFDLFSHFARRRSEARGKSADEVRVIVKSALAADLRDRMLRAASGTDTIFIVVVALVYLNIVNRVIADGRIIVGIIRDSSICRHTGSQNRNCLAVQLIID